MLFEFRVHIRRPQLNSRATPSGSLFWPHCCAGNSPPSCAQDHGERDPDHHDCGRHVKVECRFAKSCELPIPVVMPFSGSTSRQPRIPPSAESNTDSTKKLNRMLPRKNPERAACRFRGTAAPPPHTSCSWRRNSLPTAMMIDTKIPMIFDRRRRRGLRVVVLLLGNRVHIQPLIVVDVVDQRLGRHRIGGAHQGRTQHFDALQVGSTPGSDRPKISLSCAPCPASMMPTISQSPRPNSDLLADRSFGISLGRSLLPDHHFALARPETTVRSRFHARAASRYPPAAGRAPSHWCPRGYPCWPG